MFNDESAKYIFIPNLFHCQTLFYLKINHTFNVQKITDFASKEEQINNATKISQNMFVINHDWYPLSE